MSGNKFLLDTNAILWLKIPLVTSDKQFRTLTNFDLVYYEK